MENLEKRVDCKNCDKLSAALKEESDETDQLHQVVRNCEVEISTLREQLAEANKKILELMDENEKLEGPGMTARQSVVDQLAEARERIAVLEDALRGARPYVPEHHGPVIYKIEKALGGKNGE